MAEKQEKVWVVSKARLIEYTDSEGKKHRELGLASPIKVFDDRSDARDFVEDRRRRTRKFRYFLDGVKKG